MKKLLILIAATSISLAGYSQPLNHEIYFRFGYSIPSWKQFGLDEQQWNNMGIDSRNGATFEFGTIFMINKILNQDNAAFGINVDYLYINGSRFKNISDVNDLSLALFRLGSKIGPSFTYSPVDKMAFDVYAKVDCAWATGAATYYTDLIDDAEDSYMGYVDFGFSTGINFRYGLLIVGFEYNTINLELESYDYPGDYLQEQIEGMKGNTKSKLPSVNFTLGMSF